jgi:putative CocE/NonD family hydrolase
MRDGKLLWTTIYSPVDQSEKWPILMQRTPYSCRPYGEGFPGSLGPETSFVDENYIYVYQDVRGRYMSEGDFNWMNPYIPNKKPGQVDESTDTYDTIEWLIKNVKNNNGRVGIYGTSYPGHYAAQALIDPHPALKAASPQAPMDDNWLGDDMHHNGATFWPHAMNFMAGFGVPRPGNQPVTQYPPRAFNHTNPDGYQAFLEIGSTGDSLKKLGMDKIPMWKLWLEHPNYDEYWQKQQVSQHLKKVNQIPVLVVGGWFDAEDLQGPLRIYRRIQEFNKNNRTHLVMGPWYHGSWNGGAGDTLWDQRWPTKSGEIYRTEIQKPFFDYYLKDKGSVENLAKVTMFDTGTGTFSKFSDWPPKTKSSLILQLSQAGLIMQNSAGGVLRPFPSHTISYISDPAKPVPASQTISTGMPREYLLEDQRFAAKRPDVVALETPALSEDITLAGPIKVHLKVATSGKDADYVVKVIDVFPYNYSTSSPRDPNVKMGGYQMLLRGEPMRARFRNSWSKPEPMKPGQPTNVDFEMPDIFHTFKKGHKIMIQIQSSWFPIIDRNPQSWVDNINFAKPKDYISAKQTLYCGDKDGSAITIPILSQ